MPSVITYRHRHGDCLSFTADTIFLLSSCRIIFYVLKSINLKQGRVFAAVRSLSSASFGIYLVHVGVMDIITRYFMIDASPLVSSLYLFVLTVPISAALSLVIGKVKYLT